MPNVHDQITQEDFKAPAGKFRIIWEEMSDGKLSIIADCDQHEFAVKLLKGFRETKPEDHFTLCDENGIIEEMKDEQFCDAPFEVHDCGGCGFGF